MSNYFTYILECSDGTYYVGKTVDLKKRLRQHNGEIKGGAKYTSGRRPVILRFAQDHETLSEALKNEYTLKRLTKNNKTSLIKDVDLNKFQQ